MENSLLLYWNQLIISIKAFLKKCKQNFKRKEIAICFQNSDQQFQILVQEFIIIIYFL